MKVKNMTSKKTGRAVPNQFVITTRESVLPSNYERKVTVNVTYFQSYDSIIARVKPHRKTALDEKYWDYSRTTGRYRNQFLDETTRETQAKIDSGEYVLTNLN